MIEARSETDEKNLKSDWQAILWRMKAHRIAPASLAYLTKYPEDSIRKGISGELIPITLPFLHGCVRAFELVNARKAGAQLYADPVESMSYDECIRLIKPAPAMPPRQGNFWEVEESKG